MYNKFKFFAINPEGGFNIGYPDNIKVSGAGLELQSGNSAAYYSLSFDSQTNGNIWHRIWVEAYVPLGMHYEVAYIAGNSKDIIDGVEDVDLFMLDKSIKKEEKIKKLSAFWDVRENEITPELVNAADALFINAKGRYLWIRIRLDRNFQSDDKGAISIKRLRIYYPRMSFLSYLPRVYQEDDKGRDFLERFLSIFSTVYEHMEEKIDNVAQYFDGDYVTGDYLKWLSSWLAIKPDDRWEQVQLRKFIKKAPEIYKIRGTKVAIEKMIEIFTGQKPVIIEYFQYRDRLIDPYFGKHLIELYGDDPYTFTVLVSQEQLTEAHQRMALAKILDEEKPAYTKARLIVLTDNMELDGYTYIGVNSAIPVDMGSDKLLESDPYNSMFYNNKKLEIQEDIYGK